MKEMKKFSWARLVRPLVALTLVMALLLCCGCGNGIGSTKPQQITNPHALGDGDGQMEAQDVVDGISKIYGKFLGAVGGPSTNSTHSEMDIALRLGGDILNYLSVMMESNGLPSDVSWLEQIGIHLDTTYQGNLMHSGMALNLDKNTIIHVDAVMDMPGGMMYMGVPTLADQYLGVPLEMEEANASMTANLGFYTDMVSALPTEAELNTLLTRYLNIMLEKLEEPVVSDTTLSYQSISQKVTATTHTVRDLHLLEMAKAALTAAQTDVELEKMLDAFSAHVNKTGSQQAAAQGDSWYDQDLHQDLMDAVDEALTELEDAREYMEEGNYLALTVYTADKEQVGFELAIHHADGEAQKVYLHSLTEGENTALEMDMLGVRLVGTGTVKSDKANGVYELYMESMNMAKVEVKDFDLNALKRGELDGTLRLSLSDEFIEETMGPNMFLTSATVLEIVMKTAGDNASFTFNLYNGSAFVVGMSVNTKMGTAGEIRVPTDYVDATDSMAVQTWTSNADFAAVLQNLRKAGVPEQLVAMLESSLGIG